jgi:hypothetical protein
MSAMSRPETIVLWLDEASLWIVETADHDFDVRHRMMCEAIDIASDHFRKETVDRKKKQSG